MKTTKQIEETLKEIKKNEKRIKLLNNLLKVQKDMKKLNGSFDLVEILANKPEFEDDFFHETTKLIKHIEETNSIIKKDF